MDISNRHIFTIWQYLMFGQAFRKGVIYPCTHRGSKKRFSPPGLLIKKISLNKKRFPGMSPVRPPTKNKNENVAPTQCGRPNQTGSGYTASTGTNFSGQAACPLPKRTKRQREK